MIYPPNPLENQKSWKGKYSDFLLRNGLESLLKPK